MNGVKDVELVAAHPAAMEAAAEVSMFERLACDPNADVAKLEKLVEMQKWFIRQKAEAAFNADFSQMQSEMPEISEKGQILVKGVLRSTYAKLEDIHAQIKPVLKLHGFAIRHRTEWPADKPGVIRIVGILSHAEGHSEESVFEAPMDKSDYRTDIQSMGSTVSYGRRYTTLDLLNIATRGMDNGGQGKPPEPPKAPEGFAAWWEGMNDLVPEGIARYHQAWKDAPVIFKEHVTGNYRADHEARKQRAQKVGQS